MSDLKFRPRFRIETELEEKAVAELVREKLRTNNPEGFESTVVQGHLILKINRSKKHFWSPQMDVSLNPIEEGKGTLIRCLLAPEPAVWTMFMFFYAVAGFGAFVGLMIAMSQWTLERDIWGIYLFLISTFLGVVLFFIAQFGKKISTDEMKALKEFFTTIEFK